MLRIQLLVHGCRGLWSNVWVLSAPHMPEFLFLPIVAWHVLPGVQAAIYRRELSPEMGHLLRVAQESGYSWERDVS